MASSYTSNSGIEKPAEGDQTGEWGDTVNTNMDIIDRAINGVGAITLSGTTHTLTTTDGTLSDGGYKVLVLGGSPSGTNTITISPNDQDKVYIVVNSSGQTATFTQGSGGNVNVLNGDTKIIYSDGAGSGAAVVDVTANLSFSSVNIDGGTIDGAVIGGTTAAAGTFTTLDTSSTVNLNLTTDSSSSTSGALIVDGGVGIAKKLYVGTDADIDGTLEADAMTLNGTAITTTATLSTGISNTNVPVFTTGVADDDFLRVAGTSIEGRSAAEVLYDIGASAAAGSGSIVTTGALDSGSITSGFGTINNGSSAITTTGLISGGSLDIDDVVINGSTIGHTDDTDLITVANGVATVAGEVSMTTLDIGGTNVTSTATELNKLDGATVTTTEINYLDITTLGTSEASKAVTVDSNGDLLVPDSDKFKFGAGSDMQLYHDGTNSYITNGTGILKIATETSGIAINIGHGTSEVTFGDNVTVTGDFTVNGTTTTINTTNLTVTDPLVKFGQGYTGTAYDEGFIVTRGNGSASNTANKGFIWDESADEFAAIACNTEDGTTAGNVTINSYADLQIDKLTAGSLDISGDADIDGTLEADAMTLNGTAITATATLSTGISNTNVPVFTSGVADDDFLRVAGTSIEGRSAAEVLSDIGGQASLTFGISNTNAVKIDSASVADDEYARFTANGLESRSTSEVLSDIGASAAAGSSSIVTTGALDAGSITSGFGSIDNGSSAITTTGVITGGTVEATTDTAAGDNAAIGYTSAEGLILTGQGSTSDVTIKNDADATVLSVPTGTTKVGIGLTNPTGQFAVSDGTRIAEINPHSSGTYIGNRSNHDVLFQVNASEKMRITTAGTVGVGTSANLSGYVNLPESDYGEGFNWFSSGTAANRGGIGHYSYESRIYYGASDNLTFVDGGPSGTERMRIAADGNVIVKKTAAGGVTIGADSDTSNTSDTFLTLEGTSETHGSAVIQKGLAGNTTFYQNVVYHTDCTSAEEVSRITGSGTNGFMMLIRVHTCGHTGAVGDGYDIKYYTWSGASSTPTQVYSLGGGGNNPDITVSVPSANVLVVNVASADATNTYRGAVQIEYLVPNDFGNSTWVVS